MSSGIEWSSCATDAYSFYFSKTLSLTVLPWNDLFVFSPLFFLWICAAVSLPCLIAQHFCSGSVLFKLSKWLYSNNFKKTFFFMHPAHVGLTDQLKRCHLDKRWNHTHYCMWANRGNAQKESLGFVQLPGNECLWLCWIPVCLKLTKQHSLKSEVRNKYILHTFQTKCINYWCALIFCILPHITNF